MARRKNAAPAVLAAQAAVVSGAQAPTSEQPAGEQVALAGGAEAGADPAVAAVDDLPGDTLAGQVEPQGLALQVINHTPSHFREIPPGQSARVEFASLKQREAFVRMVAQRNELDGRESIKLKEPQDG